MLVSLLPASGHLKAMKRERLEFRPSIALIINCFGGRFSGKDTKDKLQIITHDFFSFWVSFDLVCLISANTGQEKKRPGTAWCGCTREQRRTASHEPGPWGPVWRAQWELGPLPTRLAGPQLPGRFFANTTPPDLQGGGVFPGVPRQPSYHSFVFACFFCPMDHDFWSFQCRNEAGTWVQINHRPMSIWKARAKVLGNFCHSPHFFPKPFFANLFAGLISLWFENLKEPRSCTLARGATHQVDLLCFRENKMLSEQFSLDLIWRQISNFTLRYSLHCVLRKMKWITSAKNALSGAAPIRKYNVLN